MSAFVYLLRLKSGGLYVGSCTDVDKRYLEHCKGKASRMTKLDPPVDLVYREECKTFVEARRREAQIKHWSRTKKEALISGDIEKLRLLSKSRKNM
jgi:putative endonuclease